MKNIILAVASIALAITGLAIDTPYRQSAYDICWNAHQEVNGASEEACGEALDREQSIFLCNKASTVCWTEGI